MATRKSKALNIEYPSAETVQIIQQSLLSWYQNDHRDLPWRKNTDPYSIWVSEIMLQQTRVDTVIPYYERFMKQFPTIFDLAQATDEQVVKAWEGLGYYSRARNLHAAAKEVVGKYGGRVPDDLITISSLKGVGPYTAGAILSIAYNKKVPAVDGNVMRVFSRLFALTDDIASISTRKKMEKIAEHLIPDDAPGDFNQALMELGAMICTPTSPQCLFCPVQSVCNAYHQGIQEELPRKKKAKPPQEVPVVVAWITCDEYCVVEKRENHGLLRGMWSLPTWEEITEEDAVESLQNICAEKQLSIKDIRIVGKLEHIFSHRHWKITIVAIHLEKKQDQLLSRWKWINIDELEQIALPNVYRKALDLLF
ncbi:A/G-specific adenine glycosylase [Thermoflavimicrobium dichotomicum]|uniref:Adenine DNA glycosylase n=1 Tax=Thermoflavimicrobium dichotomicum TaxID=46223 RepID=A0A1I3JEW9_9BACL|nr:A/G-specific adenine glycosylase [Thermoflavimicrobium dichotomicum]SFI58832.1 A/G-specific adenine glycosylase [Thermoflavimicrobium dichotomicum]